MKTQKDTLRAGLQFVNKGLPQDAEQSTYEIV